MIPGLYTCAATAIVAGALAFGGGWKVQAWRYDAQIATTASQHATALASANQKALDDTIKMQRTKDDAIKAAEQRAAQNAAAAAAARRTADGLRAQLASANSHLANATHATCTQYASTAAELLAQCAEEVTDLAAKADGHANDAAACRAAWPVIHP